MPELGYFVMMRGWGVCGWIIDTSSSVRFDCLILVCIVDKRMYVGIFSYILYEFRTMVLTRVVITRDINDQNFYVNKNSTDATACRCLFTAKLLYIFRVL